MLHLRHIPENGFLNYIINRIIAFVNALTDKDDSIITAYQAADQTLDNTKIPKANISQILEDEPQKVPSIALLKETIKDLTDIAEGKSEACVTTKVIHTEFASSPATVTIEMPIKDENNQVFWDKDNKPRIGDILYVKDLDIYDYWVSKVTAINSPNQYEVTFSRLETQKIDLSLYVDSPTQEHKATHIWRGTEIEYEQLQVKDNNTIYITTNDKLMYIHCTPIPFKEGETWEQFITRTGGQFINISTIQSTLQNKIGYNFVCLTNDTNENITINYGNLTGQNITVAPGANIICVVIYKNEIVKLNITPIFTNYDIGEVNRTIEYYGGVVTKTDTITERTYYFINNYHVINQLI